MFIAVNTLGYSRRFHVWGTVSQDAAHTCECLVRSFAYLGGVTKTVLVDNQKSAVIAHRVGEGVQFHPRFLDLAGHYGFVPKACRPYRARTNLNAAWQVVREKAELKDVRVHDLRHSFASRALALGHSLTTIGRLLGHRQPQTTARYAHLARHSVKSTAEQVADSLLADITTAPEDSHAT